jgi:D-alanyl-lipoteichoic acid acyltransferase DltB (MBOAT superfamily)
MMQFFNYVGMAYNYTNGAKNKEELSDGQIKRRILEKPKYLDYIGYIMFTPACLVGPVYEYHDF